MRIQHAMETAEILRTNVVQGVKISGDGEEADRYGRLYFVFSFLIFGCCGVLASILVMRRFRGEYEGEDERREKEREARGGCGQQYANVMYRLEQNYESTNTSSAGTMIPLRRRERMRGLRLRLGRRVRTRSNQSN